MFRPWDNITSLFLFTNRWGTYIFNALVMLLDENDRQILRREAKVENLRRVRGISEYSLFYGWGHGNAIPVFMWIFKTRVTLEIFKFITSQLFLLWAWVLIKIFIEIRLVLNQISIAMKLINFINRIDRDFFAPL